MNERKTFVEVVKNRKSIRKYKDENIDIEKIKEIISLSSNAPSGGNFQNWHCIIIRNKTVIEKMRESVEAIYKKIIGNAAPSYYTFFTEAPVVLAVIEKPYYSSMDEILEKTDKERNYIRKFIVNPGLQGVSSFITHILLAVENEGLGACWMTGPLIAKEEIEAMLGVRKPDNLVALIPVGHKIERKSKSGRKEISEIITIID